jgi:hypothetical protein
MPAEAGIQGREGMDTGFRRYDEIGQIAPVLVFLKESTRPQSKTSDGRLAA